MIPAFLLSWFSPIKGRAAVYIAVALTLGWGVRLYVNRVSERAYADGMLKGSALTAKQFAAQYEEERKQLKAERMKVETAQAELEKTRAAIAAQRTTARDALDRDVKKVTDAFKAASVAARAVPDDQLDSEIRDLLADLRPDVR
jgi:predicted  nucleic acid-binding Zn-ribbon protein